jgi:toxin ParE1/3/4
VKVRFTPSAREHFLDAVTYTRSNNPLAAARFGARAGKVLRRLTPHPASGRKIPEFPAVPHREVIVAPYRFFYRVHGNVVWIVAVWDGAQLPDDPAGSATSEG